MACNMGSDTWKKPVASIPKVEIVLKKEAVISSEMIMHMYHDSCSEIKNASNPKQSRFFFPDCMFPPLSSRELRSSGLLGSD